MRRTVFLAATSLVCVLGVSAQQHNIDTWKSTLTIHVGKTGVFSGLGHEHEVRAPILSGMADTGSHPAVEMHVDARALRVIGKDDSEKDRAKVQKTITRHVFVSDRGNHRIQVFDENGKFLDMWPLGEYAAVYHLLLTADRNLWMSDGHGSFKIYKYNLDGKMLYSWGVMGAKPG